MPMNLRHMLVAASGLAAVVVLPSLGFAQSLGSAASFAVLAGSTVTCTGATTILGSVGVSPGTGISGIPEGQPTGGTIHDNDPVAAQAQADLTVAYNALAGMACGTDLTGQDLGGQTLAAGVYCFNTSAGLTGTLTLDGQGNANAIFVFQIGSTLTSATSAVVNLTGNAQATNVYWQVGSAATLGTGSAFKGNIVALSSITLTTGATLDGRALARTGAVTMDTNSIGDPSTPTLASTWGMLKRLYR
jgi:ice-binding like protein